MEQTGYVVEKKDDIVKIRVERESACGGNCVSCKGCPSSAVIVSAKDEIGLNKGDMVTLIEDSGKVIKYSCIGYGLMAVLLCLGAVIGFMQTGKDIYSLIYAVVFLLVGFLIVKFAFRNVESEFKIKEKIER